MGGREIQSREHKVSMALVDQAGTYVRRMVAHEAQGWGDQAQAQSRIEARYGISFWALDKLRTGRAKTIEAGLFARVRSAYLDLCQRQVDRLQHDIAIEKAIGGNDSLEDLEREAARLAAKIAAAREARKVRMG